MLLQAGAARIDITPPLGQPMAGYPPLKQIAGGPLDTADYIGREGVALGTHDPLYARALVLDDGQQVVAFVALDLIAVEAEFTTAVRSAIHAAAGIPPQHVVLAASHTHAGPDLFRWTGGVDPSVEPTTRQRTIEVVLEAYRNRRPARIGWADAQLTNISINRRHADGPIDPRVGVTWVEDTYGDCLALMVNFAVHTCLLPSVNLYYSADVSGFAMTTLERAYPGAVALFLNGAAGNINPAAHPWGPPADVVPLFRKAYRAGLAHPRTMRNADRLGKILAGAVLQAAEQVHDPLSDVAIRALARPASLPLKTPPELAQYKTFMGFNPDYGGARLHSTTLETEVQAIAVGPTVYVALPGEPFVELGLDLQRRLQSARTYVIGYANDDARYVLPRPAYLENRYDTWGSMLAIGSGELLVEAAYQAAREVMHG
jgi:hypothetical protein